VSEAIRPYDITVKPSVFLFLFALVIPAATVFAGWDGAGFKPKVEVEYKVELSSAMAIALQDYDPEFQIWDAHSFSPILRGIYEYKSFQPWKQYLAFQTPSAVIGDFNGDAIPDIALLGHNKTTGKRIVVLSSNTGYLVQEFTRSYPLSDPLRPDSKIGHQNIEEYLEFVPQSKIKANTAYKRPELDLKTDAFKFGVFERSSSIYIYKDAKFHNYTLSD